MTDRVRVAPARRRGLAGEVADRIRDAIFSGAYPPGAQLREVELSGELDVSRGPVREALLLLEREGLVRSAWHRGATVTRFAPEDIAELDSLRDVLEQLAVRRVIAHAAPEDLAAIDAAVERMDRAGSEHEMVRCDIAFHDAVYAAARHRRLLEAWQAIRSQVHLFLLTRTGLSSADYLAHVAKEHRGLAAALRARDTRRALALFADHRRHAFDALSDTGDGTDGPPAYEP
ncbi:DNA-binding GntR family transcriptional regulator [Murinocardiopsis flavida]|uniref:DNA-binding GntR family transcriptional regulator n=1 Tax=Murinocardiopsis flavida TaxID=645275 RepID=A0A2P8CJB0_9ACTN|nr:GntR family transcriptional regulator [Murinocardiopsis flavida]PSK85033.1 DNA-binding GntR family transcriptional regulator [Murinocardiopsis flavida]